MILIRTWSVDPRCSKGSVWLGGFCFPKCCTLWCWKWRNTQWCFQFMLGQKGRQSSCNSPFTFSGQVWMSDIVTLTVFRPCLSSFPPALLKSHSFFRPSLFFPPGLHWFICFLLLLIFGNVAPQRFSRGLTCPSPCPFTRSFLTTSGFQTHFAVSLYLAANSCKLRYNWINGI